MTAKKIRKKNREEFQGGGGKIFCLVIIYTPVSIIENNILKYY